MPAGFNTSHPAVDIRLVDVRLETDRRIRLCHCLGKTIGVDQCAGQFIASRNRTGHMSHHRTSHFQITDLAATDAAPFRDEQSPCQPGQPGQG